MLHVMCSNTLINQALKLNPNSRTEAAKDYSLQNDRTQLLHDLSHDNIYIISPTWTASAAPPSSHQQHTQMLNKNDTHQH